MIPQHTHRGQRTSLRGWPFHHVGAQNPIQVIRLEGRLPINHLIIETMGFVLFALNREDSTILGKGHKVVSIVVTPLGNFRECNFSVTLSSISMVTNSN